MYKKGIAIKITAGINSYGQVYYPYPFKKKKYDALYQYFVIVFSVLFLVFGFYYAWYDENRMVFKILMCFYFLAMAIHRLDKRRREHFLEITDTHLAWLVSESADRAKADWNDIRGIKKEQDGGITVFRINNASPHFRINEFSPEDQIEILKILQEKANTRQIRLINFSEPASAVA